LITVKPVMGASITVDGRRVEYRVIVSKAAGRLRLRVGPSGVEVIRPARREAAEVRQFLIENAAWVIQRLDRNESLHGDRKPVSRPDDEILFRGVPTRVRLELRPERQAQNRVHLDETGVVVVCGGSAAQPARSLEGWLRRQARLDVERYLVPLIKRLKRRPNRIYIMGQRTKWGNCSARGNLSFNWRTAMAPDNVMRYLVTHEAVHLAIPDQSRRFWLTVNSLCPDAERARQWLSVNSHHLMIDFSELVSRERISAVVGS
jgi:predicted metal-dependent hydrolase